MKPFKKRKIYIEPVVSPEETINTALNESRKLLFPYESQKPENLTTLVKALTKNVGNDEDLGADFWRKITLVLFYVRKSLKNEDASLNTFFITEIFQKHFDALMTKSIIESSDEWTNFYQLLQLFFSDSPKNFLHFILSVKPTEKNQKLLSKMSLKLISASSFDETIDDFPSYTRTILVCQKILKMTDNDEKLEKLMIQSLPDRAPFAPCDDEKFQNLLTKICSNTEMTKDFIKSPFKEEICQKFLEFYR